MVTCPLVFETQAYIARRIIAASERVHTYPEYPEPKSLVLQARIATDKVGVTA